MIKEHVDIAITSEPVPGVSEPRFMLISTSPTAILVAPAFVPLPPPSGVIILNGILPLVVS